MPTISISLSEEEKKDLKRAADDIGMGLSAYMRYKLKGYSPPANPRRKPRDPIEKELLFNAMSKNLEGKVKFRKDGVIEVEPW